MALQALGNFGSGMMQAGQPSRMPTGFLGALGAGAGKASQSMNTMLPMMMQMQARQRTQAIAEAREKRDQGKYEREEAQRSSYERMLGNMPQVQGSRPSPDFVGPMPQDPQVEILRGLGQKVGGGVLATIMGRKPPAQYGMVQSPYGRGGVGQRNKLTGQISGYQQPIQKYSGKVHLDKAVGKYYQTNPKTGKREYVSPNQEWKIESDGKGGFTMTMGKQKTASGLQKSTRGHLERKLIAANEGYERLKSLRASFKPEYQELGTRWKNLVTGLKAKVQGGKSINKKDRRLLTEYASHRRGAFENLNSYIKDITGAQVSAQEAVRIKKAVPDPGSTLLGGDDPITNEAKLNSAMMGLEKAKIRYAFYLKKGITYIKEIAQPAPLDPIQVHINVQTGGRGMVIEGEWVQL